MEAADAAACRGSVEKYLRQTRQPQRAVTEGRHTVPDPHYGIVDLIGKAYIWGVLDLPDAELRSRVLARWSEA